MKIVFMGTPSVAAIALESLLKKYPICAIVSQPDRPQGRGLVLAPTPTKSVAARYGIEVLQPEKSRDPDFIKRIQEICPDLIVVVAYGGLLTKPILDIPRLGCVNLHSSLLPKYRGATPVQWAVIRGEQETGWTTFYLNEKMDAGQIIFQKKIQIDPEEDAGTLFERMIPEGVTLLYETLEKVIEGSAPSVAQNDTQVSLAPKMKKSDGLIDWRCPAVEIKNRVRGLIPWPVAYTFVEKNGKRLELRIFRARVGEKKNQEQGKVIHSGNEGLLVSAGEQALWIKEVQLEGSRRMNIQDFLRGHRIPEGMTLG